MARATGIEIGETAVVVAELDGSPKKHRLFGASRVPIEADDAADAETRRKAEIAALKQAMKAAKSKKETVCLGVRADRAVVREIQLPFVDDEQIKKVVKFESESHLHGCDIDDVVVAYHKMGSAGGKSRLLIFAVRKDEIRRMLDVARSAGVDPQHVTIDAAGLFNLFQATRSEDPEGAYAVVDVGDRTTTVVVAAGDKLRAVRTVRLGADSVVRRVAADLAIDAKSAAAETAAVAEATDEPFALAGDATPGAPTKESSSKALAHGAVRDGQASFAKRLSGEILRTVTSALVDRRLDGLVLTGLGADAPGLLDELRDALGVPTRRIDLSESADAKASPHAAGATTAAGLGLVALGEDALGLDFRQEEFRFARKFDRVKAPLLLASVLTFVIIAFLSIGEHLYHRQLEMRGAFVGEGAKKLARQYLVPLALNPNTAQVVGQKNKDAWEKAIDGSTPEEAPATMLRLAAAADEAITKNYGMKPGSNAAAADSLTTSALTRLASFMGALKKAKDRVGPFTIDKLRVAEFEITWTMTVQESARWDALKAEFDALEGSPLATRGNDRPDGATGMRRLEGCKLEWARPKDR